MRRVSAGTVARVYLIVVLLLAVLVSSSFQAGLAVVLLALQLFLAYRQPKPSLNLVLVVGSLVFTPLALVALAGPVFAALFVIPALFLLDGALRNFASRQVFSFLKVGRNVSPVWKTLGIGLAFVLLFSIIVWNLTLVLTVAVLFVYLGVALASVFRKIPNVPLQESKTWDRLVAGESDSKVVNIQTRARVPTFVSVTPVVSWVKVEPSSLAVGSQSKMDVTLHFTPQLAGPSSIQLQACVVDLRGLTVTGQVLEPVDLHIIPRAKYAQWLANKFLERTSAGAGMTVAVPVSNSKATKRGVEFYGSRPYQPGDYWKDIDWKHSYMLGELITKEYAGGQGSTTVLVCDLTANDAEEADKLAYNFVMSALTLATEALPTALAVYSGKEILAATPPMNPRENLKRTLELTGKIRIVERKQKVLQPAAMRNLKRTIGQLNLAKTGAAGKLGEFLELELNANQELARNETAAQALRKVCQFITGPATVAVLSITSQDLDSLLFSLEQLQEKGYSIVKVA